MHGVNTHKWPGYLCVPVFLFHLVLDLTFSPGARRTEGFAEDSVIQLLYLTLQLSIVASGFS